MPFSSVYWYDLVFGVMPTLDSWGLPGITPVPLATPMTAATTTVTTSVIGIRNSMLAGHVTCRSCISRKQSKKFNCIQLYLDKTENISTHLDICSCWITSVPVITSLADHFDVPSSTDCFTAFMWPPWDFFSTLNTFLQSTNKSQTVKLPQHQMNWPEHELHYHP